MIEERKVSVDILEGKKNYKESPLFCNLILEKEMNKEDMKKNKARGSLTILGLTRAEAENVIVKLHDAITNKL